jgi:hypothetical protein
MTKNDEAYNPWTDEDERGHPQSVMEWWCPELFFTVGENTKRYSFKTSMTEWHDSKKKLTGSLLNMTLFDHDQKKHFTYYSRNNTTKLFSEKDRFFIRYEDSFIKGKYPDYEMHFHDPTNQIELDLKYHATAMPHWVAQHITNGWLPMGLGFYRYGFIPRGTLSGTMKQQNQTFSISGKGYFEHVWGNFSYSNPFERLSELKKTISTYVKLVSWWIHSHKIRIPSSITFTTENNPFGYDWIWALFDNDWTIFYGNILFWVMQGPAAGTLIFSRDGKTYTEFSNITFTYKKMQRAKEYDFYYPTELELTARNNRETLYLHATMTAEPREYINKFSQRKYWLCFAICEAPGIIDGYYSDDETRTELRGMCKIEPQRQVSILGHNMVKIDIVKPPQGFGISKEVESHFLKKHIKFSLMLLPKLHFSWSFKRL